MGSSGFFNQQAAESYDEKNRGLAPISDNMHFLIRLVLEELPADARILCVGVGTGAEILALAKVYPQWRFVGVDPSAEMLGVCRDRLAQAGVTDRCELIQGFVQDAPPDAAFDAVLGVLVAHFIPRADRPGFYHAVHARLKPGGYFVSTEICADMDAPEIPAMLRNWERVQMRMGATAESLRNLHALMRDKLAVLPPAETDACLKAAGFKQPVPFFQAFMIRGVFSVK